MMQRYGNGSPQRAGTGVRGSVEYRKISEEYVGQKKYPAALFATVNAVLILLALLLLLAAIWVFTPLHDMLAFGKEEREVTLTFTFYDTDGVLSAQALAGTSLFGAARNAVIGEITGVTVTPLEKDVIFWQDGWTALPSDAPTDTLTYPVQTVTVTVRACLTYRAADGYYTAWGEKLYVGGNYALNLGGTLATGSCTAFIP